jgi:hypothetical protein
VKFRQISFFLVFSCLRKSGGVEERCHLNEVLKNRGVLLCFLEGAS